MMENIEAEVFSEPFPHVIFHNFYNKDELDLIWEELNFYTKPGKLLEAKDFGGVINKTNSHALLLDDIYKNNHRALSNILTVNRKVFDSAVLETFAKAHDCCSIAPYSNWDCTKTRYYHNDEYYEPHTDKSMQFLAFSYFHKEPKKFSGGDLIFPKYDYKFECPNNSLIMMPGWVEHGVSKVKIEDSEYYDGYGRYSITSFFGNKKA